MGVDSFGSCTNLLAVKSCIKYCASNVLPTMWFIRTNHASLPEKYHTLHIYIYYIYIYIPPVHHLASWIYTSFLFGCLPKLLWPTSPSPKKSPRFSFSQGTGLELFVKIPILRQWRGFLPKISEQWRCKRFTKKCPEFSPWRFKLWKDVNFFNLQAFTKDGG